MFGRPPIVGEAHEPAKGAASDEAEVEDADAEDVEDEGAAEDAVPALDGETTNDGAIGFPRVVLLWKLHPAASIEAKRATCEAIFFMVVTLTVFGLRSHFSSAQASEIPLIH